MLNISHKLGSPKNTFISDFLLCWCQKACHDLLGYDNHQTSCCLPTRNTQTYTWQPWLWAFVYLLCYIVGAPALLKSDSLVLSPRTFSLFLKWVYYFCKFRWDKCLLLEPKEQAADSAPAWAGPLCVFSAPASLVCERELWHPHTKSGSWPTLFLIEHGQSCPHWWQQWLSLGFSCIIWQSFLSGGRCQKWGPCQLPPAAGIWFPYSSFFVCLWILILLQFENVGLKDLVSSQLLIACCVCMFWVHKTLKGSAKRSLWTKK